MARKDAAIEKIENEIKSLKYSISWEDERIDEIKDELISQGVPRKRVNEYIDNAKKVHAYNTKEDDKAIASDNVLALSIEYPQLDKLQEHIETRAGYEWDLALQQENLKTAKTQAKTASKTVKEEEDKKEKAKNVDQDGHVYPVKLVNDWTNKLKQYNKQMDDFLKEIDEMDPITIDATWICKKIEAFCRRINYYLALLRSGIIKTLSKAYKQANVFSNLIDPIVNFNPTDIMQCLGWVKNVIKFFFGPYEKIITFIQDFMTYTPPLVNEATSLVSKAASVPGKLLSKLQIVAESKDGKQKQLTEVYKEYIDIHMDPITMGDIMGGEKKEVEYEQPKAEEKQRTIYQQQVDNSLNKMKEAWDALESYVKSSSKTGYRLIWVAWPGYLTTLGSYSYYSDNMNNVTSFPGSDCYTREQMARKIFSERQMKKDYSNKPINSQKFKVYRMISSHELVSTGLLKGGYSIFEQIETYYLLLNRNDTGGMEIFRKYVDFLLSFSDCFPNISSYINAFGDAVKEYDNSFTQMIELDKPSVYK